MTNQEAFDKMWAGLEAQGWERSYSEVFDSCAYRGDGGRKCAVGHLISDAELAALEDPEPGVFSKLVEDLRAAGVRSVLLTADVEFMECAQLAHDNWGDPTEREQRFRNLAVDFNLAIPKEA